MNNSYSEIPIRNIYYMLSYVFRNLKIKNKIKVECENFNNIHDLFGRLLIDGVNHLIKRGFYKQYIIKNETSSNIRGKISLNNSLKDGSLFNRKLNCEFDEFSEDILFNEIIKTTINSLIKYNDLNKAIKRDLKKLKPFFSEVNEIQLDENVFNHLNWNKNNLYYRMIINICQMTYNCLLPYENQDGKIYFNHIDYEKAIHNLFEQFIFNYYKKEFKEFKVHRSTIFWDLDPEFETNGLKHLPNMHPDIVLENESMQFIIDTKFYKETLKKHFGKEIINSNNLYQIYTYINNSDFNGQISGMLLYPTIDSTLDFKYKFKNNIIYIKTIDLKQEWPNIEENLKIIANLLKVTHD